MAQGLVLLAAPLLSRLYTPDDFGALAVYVSLLSLLVVIASLRYELAIPLAKDDQRAANVLALALILVAGISFLAGVGVWLVGSLIIRWTSATTLRPCLWLLPVGLLGAGTYQVMNFWAVRNRTYVHIAQAKLSQSGSMLPVQVGLGLLNIQPMGLVLGDVLGRAAASMTLGGHMLRRDRMALKHISGKAMLAAALRYYRFPFLATFAALANSASLQLPAILLAAYYGTTVAGHLTFGQRVVAIPAALIGQAVAQVYFAEASRRRREHARTLAPFYIKTTKQLLLIAAGPLVLLAAFGSWAFGLLFGEMWTAAGLYVQILTPMLWLQFAVAPLSQTLNLLEKHHWQFVWDVSRFISVAAVLILGPWFGWEPKYTIASYGAVMFIAYVLMFLLNMRFVTLASRGGRS